MSAVTCAQDFFRTNPLGYGATYQAHPVSLACGYEVVKYTIELDIVGQAQALEPVLKEEMQRLQLLRDSEVRLHRRALSLPHTEKTLNL